MSDRRQHWEERYRDAQRKRGMPSAFLASILAGLPGGRALDIAAGDGRNALWMASQGFAVTAIDITHGGLATLQRDARDAGLAIDLIQADLDAFPLPRDHFNLAADILFLDRNLFPAIKRTLQPGGIAVVETFLIDQRQFGHPRNPAFLLERGELAAEFADFATITYEEGLFELGDERAYLARIAARKPWPAERTVSVAANDTVSSRPPRR